MSTGGEIRSPVRDRTQQRREALGITQLRGGVQAADGVLTLVVNHLAPDLPLRGLLPSLGPARVIVAGADPVILARGAVDLEDLGFQHLDRMEPDAGLHPFVAYGLTKNMNAMFVFELARRCTGRRITVNGVHPGIIGGTGLSRESPGLSEAVGRRFKLDRSRLPGVGVGADTPFWLATSPEVEGVTGRFFVDRREAETAPHTTAPSVAVVYGATALDSLACRSSGPSEGC